MTALDKHIVVSYAQEGDKLIARAAPPSPGLAARCSQCGTVIPDADPAHIVGCPTTERFGALEGVI